MELMAWMFVATFFLLGVLLVVQISRWLVRRSPRTRSFQLVAEGAGEAVFEIDLRTRRISCTNPKGLGLAGIQTNDALQIGSDDDRVHPDDREELSGGWDRLARGDHLDVHVRLRESDGSWVWVHIHAIPGRCRGRRRPRAYGLIRRTRDLYQRQLALAEARRLETVSTIAGGVAHEFNNHLTPVRGFLELALADLSVGSSIREGLATALARVIDCSELVAQIQAYGRGSLMTLNPTDVTTLLPRIRHDLCALTSPSRARPIRLMEDWPDHLPDVELDQAQFGKALGQLIHNAVAAMPRGGDLQVTAREIAVEEAGCRENRDATPGQRILVRIADSGIGIPEPILDQVMDPFFTTHGRASAQGMGLPMVQGMMAQLGGWMEIRSVEGLGTTIELYFPIVASTLQPSPPDETTRRVIPLEEAGRMLIAADARFVGEVARSVFESEGWVVEEASSSAEAVERCGDLDAPPFDVVVLDLVMPGPHAEDTIRTLRSLDPNTRILLMSGFVRTERIETLIRETGAAFIAKPFSTADLRVRVDAMLGSGVVEACPTP